MEYVNLFIGNPLKLGLVMAILALGVFIAYRVLDIADLSVEGVFPLAGLVVVILINNNVHPLLATLIAFVLGAGIGVVTAAIHLYLRMPALLAGIVVMTILLPFVIVFCGGSMPIKDGQSTIFTPFIKGIGAPWGYIVLSAIFVVLILLFLYCFFATEIGSAIRATGRNKVMAKAQGINTNLMVIIGMALSSALVAMSGALYTQMQSVATSDAGRGTIVLGLTIIFLGEAIFRKRSFLNNIISVTLGGVVYYLFAGLILQIPNFNSTYLQVIQALIIIVIIAIPRIKDLFQKESVWKRRRS